MIRLLSDSELLRLLLHDDLHRGGLPESDIVRFHPPSGSFLQIRIQSARSASRRSLAYLVRLQVRHSRIFDPIFFCFFLEMFYFCRFVLVENGRGKECFTMRTFRCLPMVTCKNSVSPFFDKFKSAFFLLLSFI